MSNMGLDIAMKKCGIKTVKTKVGDRYVLEEMLASGYNFGGEQSGHIIFSEFNNTGDGVLSGIQLLSVMRRNNMTLSHLAKMIAILPQVLVNARVTDDFSKTYKDNKTINDAIKALEADFKGQGRVLIRPSGK